MSQSSDSNSLRIQDFWPETVHGTWIDSEYEDGVVSVIVPTYNRAHCITEALESVWQQTYRPVELIVVDDGSEDDTQAVLKKWKNDHSDDSSFSVQVCRQRNRGAGAARNLGLIRSRGEYIQFLDSDDVLHPEKLEGHVKKLAHENCDYVWSPMVTVEPPSGSPAEWVRTVDPDMLDETEWGRADAEEELRFQVPASFCIGLYHRQFCQTVGPMDETLPCWQDREYQYRVTATGGSFDYIDRPLYFHLMHEGEHVSKFAHTTKGIDACLNVVNKSQQIFYKVGIDKDVTGQYRRILKWALEAQDPDRIRRCLQEMEKEGGETRILAGGLKMFLILLGPKISHHAFNVYRNIKGS